MVTKQLILYIEKMKLDPNLSPYTKKKLMLIKDLSVGPQAKARWNKNAFLPLITMENPGQNM